MMRIAALGFINDVTEEVLIRLIKEFNVEYCEYYFDAESRIPEFCDAHGQHYLKIQSGDYVDDWNQITPLDEALIDGMSYCEAVVLRMLDRYDLWSPLGYEQRKQLYLKHLRYWNHVVVTKRLDLCLFTGIPHGVFDYVLYEVCKYHRVPVLMLTCPSLIMHTVFVTDDWMRPSNALKARFRELRQLQQEGRLPSFELSEPYQAHFLKQANLQEDPTPYYMAPKLINDWLERPPKTMRPLARALLHAVKPANWGHWRESLLRIANLIGSALEREVKVRKIRTLYTENAKPVDLAARFVYVPLHLQPECTTSPMAGAYVEQQLMVQQLAAYLPSDVLIYVKEHPVQFKYSAVSRTPQFYEDLLAIPSVRFVPEETSTFRLIDNCMAVAAGTGSAGWEAIFRGKPYLMFGHHVYQYAPGVHQISSNADCAAAIETVLSGTPPNLEELRLFLLAFEEVATVADAVAYRIGVSPTSKEENIDRLTQAYSDAIRQLGIQPWQP